MKYRKLRIAWSVVWGIACVLLIALWVRSYWRFDSLTGAAIYWNDFLIQSVEGLLFVSVDPSGKYDHLELTSDVLTEPANPEHIFQFGSNPNQGRYVGLPHWLAALLVATAATLPWFRWRFSLRTLLIVTTLVAVVLGIVVWAVRASG